MRIWVELESFREDLRKLGLALLIASMIGGLLEHELSGAIAIAGAALGVMVGWSGLFRINREGE